MTLAELYQETEASLRRYAWRLARDPERADDLVQETFLRAASHWQLLDQLNPHQRRAWLYRVLKNCFLDEQRARRREEALVEALGREAGSGRVPPPQVPAPNPFDQVPERYRELVYQRYILGMTSAEIARELGIPAATVRSRLHLALRWVRTYRARFL